MAVNLRAATSHGPFMIKAKRRKSILWTTSTRQSMVRPTALVLTTVVLLCSSPARADWVDRGVSWRCDKTSGTFSIRPLVNTSSGKQVPLQKGYSEVLPRADPRTPATKTLSCRLANASIKAIVRKHGDTVQMSLSVDKRSILLNELYNSGLDFSPVLYQVDVATTPALSITMCKGNWSWERNYDDGKCESAK